MAKILLAGTFVTRLLPPVAATWYCCSGGGSDSGGASICQGRAAAATWLREHEHIPTATRIGRGTCLAVLEHSDDSGDERPEVDMMRYRHWYHSQCWYS